MIGKDMVDHRIAHIYKTILKDKKPYKQYWYQRIKTKITGNVDIIHPDKVSLIIDSLGRPINSDMIMTLTPQHQPVGAIIHFTAPAHTRIKVLQLSIKWCIIYVKERFKDLFGKSG